MSSKRPRLLDQTPSTNWFDLPLEMREMVIDRMDGKTRCRFAQCSKMCEEEAKKSKKYLYEIGLTDGEDTNVLQLRLSNSDTFQRDYLFEFVDAGENQTNVSYKRDRKYTKWTKMEMGKPVDVRWKYFNDYVEKYKHSIRSFVFNDFATLIQDFNIKHLKKLEQLLLVNRSSEERETLNIVECGFIELKQLISMKQLDLFDYDCTFEQIVALTAKYITVSSRDFDKQNLNKYLKMMKKGEIQETVRRIIVHFEFKNHINDNDVSNITMGLAVFDYVQHESDLWNDEHYHTFNFLSGVKKNEMFRVRLGYRSIVIHRMQTV